MCWQGLFHLSFPSGVFLGKADKTQAVHDVPIFAKSYRLIKLFYVLIEWNL